MLTRGSEVESRFVIQAPSGHLWFCVSGSASGFGCSFLSPVFAKGGGHQGRGKKTPCQSLGCQPLWCEGRAGVLLDFGMVHLEGHGLRVAWGPLAIGLIRVTPGRSPTWLAR